MSTSTRRHLAFALGLSAVVAMSGFLLNAAPPQEVGAWGVLGTTDPSSARSGAAIATLEDDTTLIAGGRMLDGTVTDSVLVYDPTTNASTVVGHLASPRVNAAAARLDDGRVLIVGGEIADLLSAAAEIFDPFTGTSDVVTNMAGPRTRHAATRLADGKVLIVGGVTPEGVTATAEVFDPETGSILEAGSMTTPRAGASATLLIDNRVLVAGGNDGTQDLASAELFYPATQEFFPVDTALSQARAGHIAVLLPHNGAVLIAGGTVADAPVANAPVATTDLFLPTMFPDPYTWSMGTFGPAAHLTHARNQAVSGPMGDDGYVFVAGGGAAEGEAYAFVTLKTDKDDYAPGQAALITGSGWHPGEEVTLVFQEDPAVHPDYTLTLTADGDGNISHDAWAPEEHDLNVRFYLMATGVTSQRRAQVTFTDAKSTSTALASNNNPSDFGESVTFTATVTCTNTPCIFSTTSAPLHGVTFRDGGGNCNQGTPLSSAITVTVLNPTTASASFTTTTLSVGSHVVRACFDGPTSGDNAGASNVTLTQVVNQATVTPTLSVTNSATYNGAPQAAAVSGSVAGTVTDVKYDGSSTVPTNAGTYAITADFVPSDTSTYSSLSDAAAGNFTIDPAATTTVVTCPANATFTGSAVEPCSATVTGPVLSQALTVTYSNNVNVGTATASASYPTGGNYVGSSDTEDFTIDPAATTTVVTCPANATFTGSAIEPCSATVTGPVLSQALTVTYSNNVNVGTATASASYPTGGNYVGSSDTEDFTIDPAATTTVVTCPANATFTGSAIEPCSATVTGPLLSQALTVTYSNNVNVGTATASASYPTGGNYVGSSDTENFTIDPAATTTVVTCPANATFTGSAIEPCSATVTGPVLSQALTVSYSNNVNAGTATASASYPTGGNYVGSSDTENFTIDPAATTTVVTCPANATFTGSAVEPCSATVTGPVLSQALTVTYSNNVNVGTATASASYPTGGNYVGSSDTEDFTIDPAPTTTVVTCPANATFTGSAIEPCSATVTGPVLSQALTVSYSNNVNVGTATASASYPTGGNYVGSSDTENFTIDPAATTTVVTCPANATFTGSAIEPCSATVTGPLLSQALTVTYSNNVNVGTATASASYPTGGNYVGSSDTENFTIDPAATTTVVTCPANATFTGSAIEPCSATVTGPVLSQALTVSYSNNVNAGTATASASYPTGGNYVGSSDTENFAIDPAATTTVVTCTAGPFIYSGSAIEPCSATVTGPVLNQALTVSYSNNLNAGTATANASYPTGGNYVGSSDTENFTIDRAPSTTVTIGDGPFTYDTTTHTGGSGTVTGAGALNTTATSLTYTGDQVNAGTYYVTAHFAGDSNHYPSDGSPVAIIIQRATSTTAVTGGTFDFDGNAHAATTLVSGVGTGITQTVTLGYSGTCSSAPITVAQGTNCTATANYGGDVNHLPSSGFATITIVVRPTTTTLTSTLTPTITGVNVVLTATVAGVPAGLPIPTGTVTFTDSLNGGAATPLAGAVTLNGSGVATLTLAPLGVGQHVVTATYNPTANFGGSASAANYAPVAAITGPPTGSLNPINVPFNFTGTFTDATAPTATAAWSFDGGSSITGTVGGSASLGTVTGSKSFSAAGVYSVMLTVTDNVGGFSIVDNNDSLKEIVIAYDSNGGFVTGGGWINSPAGAYLADASLVGKANYGFVSKYKKGASVPEGETEFQFHAAGLNFKSTSYQWLVVQGTSKAQYKGTGTINGSGSYQFLVSVIDGTPDKIRVKITNGGATVYDNLIGGGIDDADPPTAVGGGSIVIHTK